MATRLGVAAAVLLGLAGAAGADEATAACLARVARALPLSEWQVEWQAWTPQMLTKAADLLGEGKRAGRVAEGWQAGESLVWSAREQPGRQVGVALARFRDEAAARAYVGLAVDLGRKQDEKAATCPGGPALKEARSQGLTWEGVDEVVRARKVWQVREGKAGVEVTQVWARKGARVAEFTWQGQPGDEGWARRVVAVLLARE